MADTTDTNWAAIEAGSLKVITATIVVGIIGFVMLIADVGPWLGLLTVTAIVWTLATAAWWAAKVNAKLDS